MKTQDLFDSELSFSPLAARIRPKTMDSFIGQEHLVGEGRALHQALAKGQLHSMILWGPPGTGKTTLAEMIVQHADAHVERISAVTSGVRDIRVAVENAKAVAQQSSKRTVLFVDEVHRFNKSQQDAFLPHIEDGTLFFIGATTENPAFELNNALLSRARVYVLKPLSSSQLRTIVGKVMKNEPLFNGVQLESNALDVLVDSANGDARRMLNTLELSVQLAEQKSIDKDIVVQAIGSKVAQFDNQGDQFYDLISAFHKSVRGSSPDAALYWYTRMLVAGCDPLYVARRLLAIVTEDIGNADPRAMQVALNAWDIYQRVGPAEGERAIAQAAIYCASAPKSNAVYQAFNQVKALAAEHADHAVPIHLRNAPTSVHRSLGHGEGYRYAHNEPYHYAAGENYLPVELEGTSWYQPTENGFEKQIKQKLEFLARLDDAANSETSE